MRSFAFDELRGVELIPSETGPGRISLQLGLRYSTGLSMIVQRRDLAVAEQTVRIARAKISRDKREAGTGSARRRWITSATIPIQSIECG